MFIGKMQNKGDRDSLPVLACSAYSQKTPLKALPSDPIPVHLFLVYLKAQLCRNYLSPPPLLSCSSPAPSRRGWQGGQGASARTCPGTGADGRKEQGVAASAPCQPQRFEYILKNFPSVSNRQGEGAGGGGGVVTVQGAACSPSFSIPAVPERLRFPGCTEQTARKRQCLEAQRRARRLWMQPRRRRGWRRRCSCNRRLGGGAANGLLRGKGSGSRHQAPGQLRPVASPGSSGHSSSLSRVMQAAWCT